MSGELSIRAYHPGDYDRARAVHVAACRDSPVPYESEGPADAAFERAVDAAVEGDGNLLVGTVDGSIVALGGLVPRDEESGVASALRVHPDHQGMGYGSTVLAALEERARRRGYRLLYHYADARQRAACELSERRDWTMVDRSSYGPDAEVIRYRKRV